MSAAHERPQQKAARLPGNARLPHVRAATRADNEIAAAEVRKILAARAARLAEIPPRTPDASELVELLNFRLGTDALSIETRFVREVIRPGDYTTLPGVPTFVVGVTNLRGEVLAIIDIRQFFGNQNRPDHDQWWVIVLGENRPEFGIVADTVCEVAVRRIEELLDVPSSVADAGRHFLKGVMADAMLIIDGTLLLHDSRLYVDQDD